MSPARFPERAAGSPGPVGVRAVGGRTVRGVRAVLLLAWLVAVVLAASIAWRAVAVIGGDAPGDRVLSQDEVSADLADLAGQPGVTDDPVPSTPSAEPSNQPLSPSTEPPAPVPTTAGADVAEVARVWPVAGGEVAARCLGPVISLDAATPADGWAVEVDLEGGEEVGAELRVEFRGEEGETRVRATCVGGVPTVTVEDRSGGDDD